MNNDNAETPVFDEVVEETSEVEASEVEDAPVPDGQTHRSPTQIAAEVHAGKWGEPEERNKKLEEAGYDVDFINMLVERGVGKRK